MIKATSRLMNVELKLVADEIFFRYIEPLIKDDYLDCLLNLKDKELK